MQLTTSYRRLTHLIVFALIALAVGEMVRFGLGAYSQAVRRSNVPIPISKSMSELALTYENTFDVPDEERLTVEESIGLVFCGGGDCPHLEKRANSQATPS